MGHDTVPQAASRMHQVPSGNLLSLPAHWKHLSPSPQLQARQASCRRRQWAWSWPWPVSWVPEAGTAALRPRGSPSKHGGCACPRTAS